MKGVELDLSQNTPSIQLKNKKILYQYPLDNQFYFQKQPKEITFFLHNTTTLKHFNSKNPLLIFMPLLCVFIIYMLIPQGIIVV